MAPNIKPVSPLVQPTIVGSNASSNKTVVPLADNSFSIADEKIWICPASAKSIRTINPIRAIVDPIVSNSTKERIDGKKMISLAVSLRLVFDYGGNFESNTVINANSIIRVFPLLYDFYVVSVG